MEGFDYPWLHQGFLVRFYLGFTWFRSRIKPINANDLTKNLVSLGRRDSPLAPLLRIRNWLPDLPLKQGHVGSSPIGGTNIRTSNRLRKRCNEREQGISPMTLLMFNWCRGVVGNIPDCHSGDCGFDPRGHRKQSKVID